MMLRFVILLRLALTTAQCMWSLEKNVWNSNGLIIFRYEIMWERVESLLKEIKHVWCAALGRGSLGKIVQVLGNMRTTLRQ
jgi:hypothetical protein